MDVRPGTRRSDERGEERHGGRDLRDGWESRLPWDDAPDPPWQLCRDVHGGGVAELQGADERRGLHNHGGDDPLCSRGCERHVQRRGLRHRGDDQRVLARDWRGCEVLRVRDGAVAGGADHVQRRVQCEADLLPDFGLGVHDGDGLPDGDDLSEDADERLRVAGTSDGGLCLRRYGEEARCQLRRRRPPDHHGERLRRLLLRQRGRGHGEGDVHGEGQLHGHGRGGVRYIDT